MIRTSLVAALAASLLAVTAPATAAEVRHRAGYADLDLSRAADVAKLDRRIRAAVADACGAASAADLAGGNAVRACRTASREEAAIARDRAVAGARQAQLAAVR